MGAENLSKMFGYTIVGNSVPDQPLHMAATEVAGQQAVSSVLKKIDYTTILVLFFTHFISLIFQVVRLLLTVPDAVYSTIVG